MREKRHKGVEKGDKAFLEEKRKLPMKRRAGVAEEGLRIKKERLDEVVQEYEEEHRTFTIF